MTEPDEEKSDYSDDETSRLETIWGEGFLSPGGSAEVAKLLGPYSLEDFDVLDIGSCYCRSKSAVNCRESIVS